MAPETIHGTTVALGEAGLIVCGGSGAGKTTLALALLDHARTRGAFARLVADDYTHVAVAGGRLIARAPDTIAGCAELRGDGVIAVHNLAAVRLTQLVELVTPEDAPRMPEDAERIATLCGVRIPRLVLPARSTASVKLVVASLLERNGLTGSRMGPQPAAPVHAGPYWRDDT